MGPTTAPAPAAGADRPAGWLGPRIRHLHLRTGHSRVRRAPTGPRARSRSSRCTPTACSTGPAGDCSTTPRARSGRHRDGSNRRQQAGDVEDGYLFVYGHDYAGALRTFAQLTGAAPLLPRERLRRVVLGLHPVFQRYIEDSLYPAFQKNQVPLNTLSLDTDWKAPNNWDGWEWNTALFPHPADFLQWARSNGIDVTLNIHSSIADDDPKLPAAQSVAGTALPQDELLRPASARSGTGARSPRPSPISPCSRAFNTRGWRSGGWTGAVTRRWCPCRG